MFFDAMNAGVNPGGLQSRTEIRVLICYLLHNSKEPLPLEKVKEKLHFNGIANYFETAFAISDLLESGNISLIKKNGETEDYYIASGECANIAETLGTSVPFSVREHSMEIVEELLSRKRNERNNKVYIEKTTKGFYITCSVMELTEELLTVKILVPDEESALIVKENFLKDPMRVLLNATNGLLGTDL